MRSQLKDLAVVEYGKSPNEVKDERGDFPVYGTGGLVAKANDYLFDSEAIIVARKGTLDKPSYVNGKFWVIDTAYAAIVKEGNFPKWLYYCLLNFDLKSLNEATGVPSISRDFLYKTQFYTPSYERQKKIAKILTTVDNLIEQTQALIDKYTAIKQGMMADLFTRGIDLSGTLETNNNYGQLRPSVEQAPELYKETELGWVPKEWEVCALSKISEKIQDGTHFSPTTGGGEYLYLTSKNVRFGYLIVDNIETIDKKQHESIYKRCDVKKGDLLLTKDGANTGNAAINEICEPFSMLSSVAFIRSNDRSTENYLLHYLLSDSSQAKIKDEMSGNAITRLTLKKINEFIVSCPEIGEQVEIADRLSALSRRVDFEVKYMEKLKTQKKGLMQDLLTGKVQVNA